MISPDPSHVVGERDHGRSENVHKPDVERARGAAPGCAQAGKDHDTLWFEAVGIRIDALLHGLDPPDTELIQPARRESRVQGDNASRGYIFRFIRPSFSIEQQGAGRRCFRPRIRCRYFVLGRNGIIALDDNLIGRFQVRGSVTIACGVEAVADLIVVRRRETADKLVEHSRWILACPAGINRKQVEGGDIGRCHQRGSRHSVHQARAVRTFCVVTENSTLESGGVARSRFGSSPFSAARLRT